MKSAITFLFILCYMLSFAQQVNHFDNENARWFVADTYPNGNIENPDFVETTTTVYGFQGDSIFDGANWMKMYSVADSAFSAELSYEGLIRSADGLVYFKGEEEEIVTLYDFNMEVGDSMLYHVDNVVEEYIEVIAIDYIDIQGEMYKQYTFDEFDGIFGFVYLNEVWIEGIGSIHGPLFPNSPTLFSDEFSEALDLTCTFLSDYLYYHNPAYETCFASIILGINDVNTSHIKLFPNPCNDAFQLSESQGINQLIIYDILGSKVQQYYTQPGKSYSIATLPKGTYMVEMIDLKGGLLNTTKLVKQ